jgi:hypothetical protein
MSNPQTHQNCFNYGAKLPAAFKFFCNYFIFEVSTHRRLYMLSELGDAFEEAVDRLTQVYVLYLTGLGLRIHMDPH